MSIAYLLGAGYSYLLGMPLTSGLVQRAKDDLAPERRKFLQPHQRMLLGRLVRWSEKHNEPDIEVLIRLADERDEARRLANKLNGRNIRWTIRELFAVEHNRCFAGPSWHAAFDAYIGFLYLADRTGPNGNPSPIATLNYDMGTEIVVQSAGMSDEPLLDQFADVFEFDYGYGRPPIRYEKPTPERAARTIPYFKVHGSTNLNFCKAHGLQEVLDSWKISAKDVCDECQEGTEPLLVYPERGKARDPHLAPVWRKAVAALEASDLIVSIGVSFNPADEDLLTFVQGLVKDGSRRLVIIDPDASRIAARFSGNVNPIAEVGAGSTFEDLFTDKSPALREKFEQAISEQVTIFKLFQTDKPDPPLFSFPVKL